MKATLHKLEMKPPAMPSPARMAVAVAEIDPDPDNRAVFEDEDFEGLVESIKVLGVLQALQVQEASSRFFLIDGERRWKAARVAGLSEVPCDVWPAEASPRDMLVAGVALNEHRTPHGCMHVAKRLRQIKNEHAETNEGVAQRTGLKLERVKAYQALFKASEDLLAFFESEDLPLGLATEFLRYEKAAGESATRQLMKRYLESPMSHRELAALRKKKDKGEKAGAEAPPARTPRPLSDFIDAAFRRDAKSALAELETAAHRLGYRLVRLAQETGEASEKPEPSRKEKV